MASEGPLSTVLALAATLPREPNKKALGALLLQLKQCEALVLTHHGSILEAVSALSYSKDSLVCTFLLARYAGAVQTTEFAPEFLTHARKLLLACTPAQIRIAPADFVVVTNAVADLSTREEVALLSVRPLMQAAAKLAARPTVLTPCHGLALRVAILARAYTTGAVLLRKPILSVEPRATALTSQHVLQYFYYGGIVFTALDRLDSAIEFFTACVAVPAQATSAIAVAAAKKLVLVSLIRGKPVAYAAYTSPVVANQLPSLTVHYEQLKSAVTDLDLPTATLLAEHNVRQFMKDTNRGLVALVIGALRRRIIQKLTHKYVTVSLEHVAQVARLSTSAAEAWLVEMVERGDIAAKIDKTNGMVTFEDPDEGFDTLATTRRLQEEIAETVALAERVRALDLEIAKSKPYVTRVVHLGQREQPKPGSGSGAGVGAAAGAPHLGVGPMASMGGMAPTSFDDVDLLGGLRDLGK